MIGLFMLVANSAAALSSCRNARNWSWLFSLKILVTMLANLELTYCP